jgi:hypothetical protein
MAATIQAWQQARNEPVNLRLPQSMIRAAIATLVVFPVPETRNPPRPWASIASPFLTRSVPLFCLRLLHLTSPPRSASDPFAAIQSHEDTTNNNHGKKKKKKRKSLGIETLKMRTARNREANGHTLEAK